MIDVIVVNYKSTKHLLQCLDSIYSSLHGIPAEIFVQDNASNDGVDLVRTVFPKVRLCKNRNNLGFAKAVNNALGQGVAPYVVILNPDTYVGKNFLASALAYMEENLDVGILGPQILNTDGSVQGSARSFPRPLTALFGRSSVLSRLFPNNPITKRNVLIDKCNCSDPKEVDWISGACMFVRRDAIKKIGFLDEQFFMYWEDADWCRRMWRGGWRVCYFPQASVTHCIGVSSSQHYLRSVIEFHKSSYCIFYKYNTHYFRLLKPLVIAALTLRMSIVLSINAVSRWRA